MTPLSQYDACVPLLKTIDNLLAEYMSLVRKYDHDITDLRISVMSYDADAITYTCEYDIPAGGICSFGWFVPPAILFGDKDNWPFYIEDYITVYMPSWLKNEHPAA